MVRTNKERKLQLNSDLFVCSTGRGRSFDCQHNRVTWEERNLVEEFLQSDRPVCGHVCARLP